MLTQHMLLEETSPKFCQLQVLPLFVTKVHVCVMTYRAGFRVLLKLGASAVTDSEPPG